MGESPSNGQMLTFEKGFLGWRKNSAFTVLDLKPQESQQSLPKNYDQFEPLFII